MKHVAFLLLEGTIGMSSSGTPEALNPFTAIPKLEGQLLLFFFILLSFFAQKFHIITHF